MPTIFQKKKEEDKEEKMKEFYYGNLEEQQIFKCKWWKETISWQPGWT